MKIIKVIKLSNEININWLLILIKSFYQVIAKAVVHSEEIQVRYISTVMKRLSLKEIVRLIDSDEEGDNVGDSVLEKTLT